MDLLAAVAIDREMAENCTCDFPAVRADNPTGHREDCVVYQNWKGGAKKGDPRVVDRTQRPVDPRIVHTPAPDPRTPVPSTPPGRVPEGKPDPRRSRRL